LGQVHLDRTPEENDELFFIRSDQPYKTLLDLRKGGEAPRCGASGVGSTGFYIPKWIEEIFGVRINVVTGYPGAADADLAVEKREIHWRKRSSISRRTSSKG
jgi:hypothetical protein